MKTTLNFDDRLIRAAKARAAEDGETLTRLIERAPRGNLEPEGGPVHDFRATLLTKRGPSLAGVDFDDRGLLYETMEEAIDRGQHPSQDSSSIRKEATVTAPAPITRINL